MSTGIVVVNRDRRDLLRQCLESVAGEIGDGDLVVVVDNGSSDGSAEAVRGSFPAAVVLALSANTGFSHANNLGIRHALAAGCDSVLLLNNDAQLAAGSLAALRRALDPAAGVGMASPKVVLSGDRRTIDATGHLITPDGLAKNRHLGLAADSVVAADETFCPPGAAALYSRAALEDAAPDGDYLDEDFFLYYEDLDLGWRARLRGWSCRFVPEAVVWHQRGATSGEHSELVAYYATRNIWFNIVKNYPGGWALRAAVLSLIRPALLLVGVLAGRGTGARFARRLPVSRLARITLRGWWDAALGLPKMWRKRRRIQARRTVSDREVRRWFRELGLPFGRSLYS